MTIYYATVVSGLEAVAWSEVHEKLPDAKLVASAHGKLTIDYEGQPEDFFELRSIENIYTAVLTIPHIGYRREALQRLEAAMLDAPLEPALQALRRVQQTQPDLSVGHRHPGKQGLRVTSTMTGERAYRRIDAQVAVEKGLLKRFQGKWVIDLKNPDVEIWVDLQPEEAHISLRLSGGLLRRREYKQAHIPASLKPTVAYAMVRLSQPEPDDIFLDPMCGAGTVLLERAYSGPYRMLYGGDIDPKAVTATLENLGKSHKPWEVIVWDARNLPLADRSVTKVVSNLPFGKQIGTLAENEHLYNDVLHEIERVLRPGGRVVLLTSRWQLLAELIRRSDVFASVPPPNTKQRPAQPTAPTEKKRRNQPPMFNEVPSISIDLLGERAYIFVLERTGDEWATRPYRRHYEENTVPMQNDNMRPANAEAASENTSAGQPGSRTNRLLQRALSRRVLTAPRETPPPPEEPTRTRPAERPRTTEQRATPRTAEPERRQERTRFVDNRPQRRYEDERPRRYEERPRRYEDERPRRYGEERPRRYEDDRRPGSQTRPGGHGGEGRFGTGRSEQQYEQGERRPRRVVDRTAEERRARIEEQERSSRTPRRGPGGPPQREERGRFESSRPPGRGTPDRFQRSEREDGQRGGGRPGTGAGRGPRSYGDDRPARGYSDERPSRGYGSERSPRGYRDDRPSRGSDDDRPSRGYSSSRPSGRFGSGGRPQGGGRGSSSGRPTQGGSSRGPRSGGPPRRPR